MVAMQETTHDFVLAQEATPAFGLAIATELGFMLRVVFFVFMFVVSPLLVRISLRLSDFPKA